MVRYGNWITRPRALKYYCRNVEQRYVIRLYCTVQYTLQIHIHRGDNKINRWTECVNTLGWEWEWRSCDHKKMNSIRKPITYATIVWL
jgi:hypothetical protein